MKICIILVSIISLAYAGIPSSGNQPDPGTCKANTCGNACQTQGKSCCYCDQTQTYSLEACLCCPVNHTCCPSDLWGQNAQCCPDGYTCTSNGGCSTVINIPAIQPVGVSAKKCRKDCTVYVTVDNSFKMYIDNKACNDLKFADNWTIADRVLVPAGAKYITIYGVNDLYKAGILFYSPDCPELNDYAVWKCCGSNSQDCDGVWRDPEEDELNDGKSSRTDVVANISRNTPFRWCNNPRTLLTTDWLKYCTCKIQLPTRP